MVEVDWRLPLVRFRVHSLSRTFRKDWMYNLRSGRALRWKGENRHLGEGQGVVCGKLAPLRLQPPPLSVKD
jgi:hypothetical protein